MRSGKATVKEMRMNRFLIAICTAPILFGIPLADAAVCKYQTQSVDPVTDEKFVQTKWDKVATMFSGGKTIGSIAAIARGDERYLAVKIGVIDYYPFPDELRAEAVDSMMVELSSSVSLSVEPAGMIRDSPSRKSRKCRFSFGRRRTHDRDVGWSRSQTTGL